MLKKVFFVILLICAILFEGQFTVTPKAKAYADFVMANDYYAFTDNGIEYYIDYVQFNDEIYGGGIQVELKGVKNGKTVDNLKYLFNRNGTYDLLSSGHLGNERNYISSDSKASKVFNIVNSGELDPVKVKEKQFNSFVAQGDKFFAEKKYSEAMEAYNKAKKLDSWRIEELRIALVKNGDSLNTQGNYPAAFDYYKKATTMGYRDEKLLEKISELLGSSGNIKDEENFFKSLTKLNPNDSVAHVLLGTFYLKLNEDEKAIVSLQNAAKLAPEEPKIPVLMGLIFLKSKKYDEAIKQLNDTLKLAPKDLSANYLLGLTYEQKGDYTSAKKYFKRALKISPNNPEIKETLNRISKEK